MNTQINDYHLIKLVEGCPILYDKSQARGQKNSAMKDQAWRRLAQSLNASERACITRWKSIRDRFGKEFRRAQEHPEEPVNWDMFQHLLFLKSHYKQGLAGEDAFLSIKYEPKILKRGRKPKIENESCRVDAVRLYHSVDCDLDSEQLVEDQHLIELVKEHPVLYDKYKIRDSKNLTLKHDAWREISESLGLSEETCYNRWKKLRDRFAREYRCHKLNGDRPVTWIYFQDLMFLEGHYRKGIPLQIEDIKPKNNTAEHIDDPWGDLRNFDCIKDESIDISRSDDIINEDDITHSIDDLLLIPSQPIESNIQVAELQLSDPMPTTEPAPDKLQISNATDTEIKLSNVISNIEHVLYQTQDCFKSLQQQNAQHRQQLQSQFSSQVGMLQKVKVLLSGLRGNHLAIAERRIVQFLCECQIKSLNNETIDDLKGG